MRDGPRPVRCVLGDVNLTRTGKQRCSQCGEREPVHAYRSNDPALPLCVRCAAGWQLLQKYLTLNALERQA